MLENNLINGLFTITSDTLQNMEKADVVSLEEWGYQP